MAVGDGHPVCEELLGPPGRGVDSLFRVVDGVRPDLEELHREVVVVQEGYVPVPSRPPVRLPPHGHIGADHVAEIEGFEKLVGASDRRQNLGSEVFILEYHRTGAGIVPLQVSTYDLKPSPWKIGVCVGEGEDAAGCRLRTVPPGTSYAWVDLDDNLVSVLLRDLYGSVI